MIYEELPFCVLLCPKLNSHQKVCLYADTGKKKFILRQFRMLRITGMMNEDRIDGQSRMYYGRLGNITSYSPLYQTDVICSKQYYKIYGV